MGALDPVREPRGPAGPRGPLVPVRLDLLVPVGGTNQDQWASLLAHHHWSRFVPPTGTNGLAQRRGGEYSPTSLAKREPHLFIRCGAPELSSSSLKQAYGPNLSVHACGSTGPSAGLNPGPWMGF